MKSKRKKRVKIKLGELRWESTKIIGPPFRIFLEGDEIVAIEFPDEELETPKSSSKFFGGKKIHLDKDTFKIVLMDPNETKRN